MNSDKYRQLGVDASKKSVRSIFKKYINTEYPYAFVNIITDPSSNEYVMTQHMDGDGSKIIQRLLIYEETKNIKVIEGAADDALQMNLGDIAASGFVFEPILVTDVININSQAVSKDRILKQLGKRIHELIQIYKKYGFNIFFLGGETADLTTQVKNITFDIAVSARAKKIDVIKGNIKPGDVIYGFASDGRAVWEDSYNSGIMSNGLTLARVGTMWKQYTKKYPHLGSHSGKYKVGERSALLKKAPISTALISPTRQWAILIKLLLEKLKKEKAYDLLHGICINTGGGVSKITHIGKSILYRKNMPTPPPIFRVIQQETGATWKEMFSVFNCGVGIDVICENNTKMKRILQEISHDTNIKLYELGSCQRSSTSNNHVYVTTEYGTFRY